MTTPTPPEWVKAWFIRILGVDAPDELMTEPETAEFDEVRHWVESTPGAEAALFRFVRSTPALRFRRRFSPADVATLIGYGLTEDRVIQAAERGVLPGRLGAGGWRFSYADLDELGGAEP